MQTKRCASDHSKGNNGRNKTVFKLHFSPGLFHSDIVQYMLYRIRIVVLTLNCFFKKANNFLFESLERRPLQVFQEGGQILAAAALGRDTTF